MATILLVQCLRTLDVLWMEYEFGIGGNKPAKLFTAREMGTVKFSCSLRTPFWTLVEKMILYRCSHTLAIEKIKIVYCADRTKSLKQILTEIRR